MAMGIQKAIDYIEEHITDELDYNEIAKQAMCSPYYFQKLFGILCGVTVGEYIRSRRLTLAGNELTRSDAKVIDTALKYGYDAPESFTRAFTKFHGITPSEVKRSGGKLKSFSRLTVQIILKGGNSMDYKIISKEAFTVLERVEQHTVSGGQNENTIPDFWDRAKKDGTINTLLSYASDSSLILGICYGNSHSDCEHFEYGIAVQCPPDTVAPEGFRVNKIPARSWVTVECVGAMPKAIQRLWHKICTEFFPVSDLKPTYEMDIEAYPDGDMTSGEYASQIWIPVYNK